MTEKAILRMTNSEGRRLAGQREMVTSSRDADGALCKRKRRLLSQETPELLRFANASAHSMPEFMSIRNLVLFLLCFPYFPSLSVYTTITHP